MCQDRLVFMKGFPFSEEKRNWRDGRKGLEGGNGYLKKRVGLECTPFFLGEENCLAPTFCQSNLFFGINGIPSNRLQGLMGIGCEEGGLHL